MESQNSFSGLISKKFLSITKWKKSLKFKFKKANVFRHSKVSLFADGKIATNKICSQIPCYKETDTDNSSVPYALRNMVNCLSSMKEIN